MDAENLEKLISKRSTEDDLADMVLIKTLSGDIVMGKKTGHLKEYKKIKLEKTFTLTKRKGTELVYESFSKWQEYKHICPILAQDYEELKKRLKAKLELFWSWTTKRPIDIQKFINTASKALGQGPEKEIEQLVLRFLEQDQALPPELDALAEKNPKKYLCVQKEIERATTQVLENTEIKRIEEAYSYAEFIKYSQKCNVNSSAAHEKMLELLKKIEKTIRKEYRQKLKKLTEIKERVKPE